MKLPLLISVPHSGLRVPPEVVLRCRLSAEEIYNDSDGGAGEIYHGLREQVQGFLTTDIARAIVDLNRAEDDFQADGVIKTHTCYNVPIYEEFPDKKLCNVLLERYYKPYHSQLVKLSGKNCILGIDCHTMAAEGPPVGPDPGRTRPLVCISNAEGSCPEDWIKSLADRFSEAFQEDVAINRPFKGGYIIRRHSKVLPYVQLELSRTSELSNVKKKKAVVQALVQWCEKLPQLLRGVF